jgi:hypothetical protein
MEDLSILLILLLVVILLGYCTYVFYRPLNIDKFENGEKTKKDEPKEKKLTDEQLEAMNVMYNMIKNSNINISNPCKLIDEFCFKRLNNENCNDDRYINSPECTTSKQFCVETSNSEHCAPKEEIVNWMYSLSDEDKKKFSDAMIVINPELKALQQ